MSATPSQQPLPSQPLPRQQLPCTAFLGHQCLAAGALAAVARAVKQAVDAGETNPILIFDDTTGKPVDLDLRGDVKAVLQRLEPSTISPAEEGPSGHADDNTQPPAKRGRGRPKLGVVSREVTLLPRHWQWLNAQPGGASVTLRKLVDQARHANPGRALQRQRQEATYRVINALAGDAPAFEEAVRALFAGDAETYTQIVHLWAPDIRDYALRMAEQAFAGT